MAARYILAMAGLSVAAGQIRVMSPRTLSWSFSGGRIDGATATFGAPMFGTRLLGEVVWAEPKNASAPHCELEDYDAPPPSKQAEDTGRGALMRIFMLRRGGCTFAQKAKHAESKGAHAVIIVDREDSDLDADRLRRYIMLDDGEGRKVHIPSIMITKQDGWKLIESKRAGHEIVVELDWQLPKDSVVRVDLWMDPASEESRQFMAAFAPKRRALNEEIRFIPHFSVYRDVFCSELNSVSGFCVSSEGLIHGISNDKIVQESLRQVCIHDTYKKKRSDMQAGHLRWTKKTEYAAEYWDYMERITECALTNSSDDRSFGEECSARIMRTAGIDASRIDACVEDRGKALLQEQANDQAWSPTAVRINGYRYNGDLKADSVVRAVCASFKSPPAVCADMVDPLGYGFRHSEGGMTFWHFIFGIFFFNGLAFISLMVYKRGLQENIRKNVREEVMLEVQAQMDAYIKLDA